MEKSHITCFHFGSSHFDCKEWPFCTIIFENHIYFKIRGRLYCESASCESASCESASCESASCEFASCEFASCESASCESASCESASCESASCEFTVGIYCLENAHLVLSKSTHE